MALMAIPFTFSVVRVPLLARMPDAVVPAVVLGAFLVGRAWASAPRLRPAGRLVSVAGGVLFSASIFSVGQPLDALDRAGLMGPALKVPERFVERTRALTTPLELSQMPGRTAAGLLPFFEYVNRCTGPDARLLTAGFLPEVSYFARRPYAAGQSTFGPWWGSEKMQQMALRRLRSQVVPFVVLPSEYREEFHQRFPLVASYVRLQYAPLAVIDIGEDESVEILMDSAFSSRGRDEQTGWPCHVTSG